MLFFENNEKSTYFLVDTEKNTANHVSSKDYFTLYTYSKYMVSFDHLVLPDYKTVQQFQKLVKSGVVHGLNPVETKSKLVNEYPEYFI